MNQEILVVRFLSTIFERDMIKFLVVPSGSTFRLIGRLLHISFLDQKGVLTLAPSEKWDTNS